MDEHEIPERVDAVVIGAGALGAATAFHLAKAGMSVVLIDRAELASQSSPRAAGLSGQLRADEIMTRIAARGVEKIVSFEVETGEPMIFFQPDSLKIARLREHEAQLNDEVKRGNELGLDVAMISLDEARRPSSAPGCRIAEVTGSIAVGTSIAERPPLRSVRAGFPHTAPTSGV
jgi:glycine/D-amino acid oxidase-like deaminating enzyme